MLSCTYLLSNLIPFFPEPLRIFSVPIYSSRNVKTDIIVHSLRHFSVVVECVIENFVADEDVEEELGEEEEDDA